MRIWDISPKMLCNQHLLGEHRELHAIWSILKYNKSGYSKHPETKRWKGKLNALYLRHESLVNEMETRKFNHHSPLDKKNAKGKSVQNEYVDSINKQIKILKSKKCECNIKNMKNKGKT
jgi:hypothetical protein